MVRTFGLLLPALIPSWAFFKAVEPSPRVQWRFVPGDETWHEFRPRPQHLSGLAIFKRLFWNPRWNETLYMVSLAERLTLAPSAQSLAEIQRILTQDVAGKAPAGAQLQFRLMFVHRHGAGLSETETYRSDPWQMDGSAS